MNRSLHLILLGLVLLAAGPRGAAAADAPSTGARLLRHAHAHNDYWHDRPLFDALEQGFGSVEADVFLVDGRLLVGHERSELSPDRTLQRLYLDPLAERARQNGGSVLSPTRPFYLHVDIKSDQQATHAALGDLLARYPEVLAPSGPDADPALVVIVTGAAPRKGIVRGGRRLAGRDGRLADLPSDEPADAMPLISDNWSKHFRWRGDGPISGAEREKLRGIVDQAHQHGRQVRFWATPESEAVWQELLDSGVDLINADELERLAKFLDSRQPPKPGTPD